MNVPLYSVLPDFNLLSNAQHYGADTEVGQTHVTVDTDVTITLNYSAGTMNPGCVLLPLSAASTASRPLLLWLTVCLCVSSIWGGTWFPLSPSSLTCARWHVSGCSGLPRTPAVDLSPDSIGLLCCAACLVSRGWTTRVSVQMTVMYSRWFG